MPPTEPTSKPLLAEFETPSRDAWRQRMEAELGARTYADLTWHTDDGFEVPPLFTRDDVDDLPHLRPELASLLRRVSRWNIRQRIDAARPELARRMCAEALAGGADELLLQFDHVGRHGVDPATLDEVAEERDLFDFEIGFAGCAAYHADALAEILADVDLAETRLAIDAGTASLPVLGMLLHVCEQRAISPDAIRLELGLDPVHELVRGTTAGASVTELLAECDAAIRHAGTRTVPLAVHSSGYHRAGASTSQELGCIIATAIEYLRHLTGAGHDIESAVRSICLRVQVNTELFLEIAKLRGARLLWAKVAAGFGAQHRHVEIHAESSERSFSSADVHTNLLRTGIQGFAATLASCDSITLATFDQTHDDRDLFAASLARNQQILLREESLLHRVQDPCRGAFAIEALTDRIAREAWRFVQEIENRGGMLAALEAGFVQDEINRVARTHSQDFQTRERTLVGISRFVDPRFAKKETALVDTEAIRREHDTWLAARDTDQADRARADDLDSLIRAAAAGCTLGEVTNALRGTNALALEQQFYEFAPDAAVFEHLRDLVEPHGFRVLPVLAGPPRASRARLEFAQAYFAAGGFTVLDPLHLAESVDIEGHDPDIVVLCSDDASYPDLVPQARGEFKLVIAGPVQEALNESVDAFVYRGSNVYVTLRDLYLDLQDDAEERP